MHSSFEFTIKGEIVLPDPIRVAGRLAGWADR